MPTRIFSAILLLTLSQIALAAAPAKQQILRASDAELLVYAPENTELETRLDIDVNGDSLIDTVFIADSEEKRVLMVLMTYADKFNMGQEPIGKLELETFPLGKGNLRFEKGVLILEDLTGGTTAISTLYRYRFDKKNRRMRLIGDDVMQYSRTNAHDSFKVSTNRLTGISISQVMKLTAAGNYKAQPAVTKKIPANAIYMEDTPNSCIALGCTNQ